MKLSSLRDVALFVLLISLPFTYNACQGGFHSSGGSSSGVSSKSCKVMMVGDKAEKVVFDNDVPPSAFASQKSALRLNLAENDPVQSKADGSLQVAAGTELAVIVNNLCVRENPDALANAVISRVALEPGLMHPDLKRQAYLWKLDKDYSDTEIEEIAAQESCLIGISWNREYEMQSSTLTLPFSDSGYASQKAHFDRVKAEAAYPKYYNTEGGMNATGTPILMAVMDTGVDYNHPDLQGNFWVHSKGWGIDATTIPQASDPDPGPIDYNPFDVSPIGHGTHVAGLIAAISGNALGTVGLMPKRAKIMSIKVFTVNNTTSSQYFYNGIQFAYLNNAAVVNISLGKIAAGAGSDALAKSGLEEAVASGTVAVTVIGNANSGDGGLVDGSTLSSIPGQYSTIPGVIGVGSIDADTGLKSYFSHYSPTYVEIAAPGAVSVKTDSAGKKTVTGLYSTKPTSMTGGYGTLAGTSQAAPLVSAAAGLVVGLVREATGNDPSPATVESLILKGANKQSALKTYFKDGNTLDLNRIANQVNAAYPLTKSSYTQPVGSSCD